MDTPCTFSQFFCELKTDQKKKKVYKNHIVHFYIQIIILYLAQE